MAEFSETLKRIVATPDEYECVTKFGPTSLQDLEEKELFFITFPKDMLDASQLINKEITLGIKNHSMKLNGEKFQIKTTHNTGWQSNNLLVWDRETNRLVKVSKSSVVGDIKILSKVFSKNNIAFSSTQPFVHSPPSLKERDFFKFPDPLYIEDVHLPTPISSKKRKKSKKSKKDKIEDFDEEILEKFETDGEDSFGSSRLCDLSFVDEEVHIRKKLKKNKSPKIEKSIKETSPEVDKSIKVGKSQKLDKSIKVEKLKKAPKVKKLKKSPKPMKEQSENDADLSLPLDYLSVLSCLDDL